MAEDPPLPRTRAWPWWARILVIAAVPVFTLALAVLAVRWIGQIRLAAALRHAEQAGFGASLAAIHAADPDDRPERDRLGCLWLVGDVRPVPALLRGDWHLRFGPDRLGTATVPEPWRVIIASAAARTAWHDRRMAGPVLIGGAWADPPAGGGLPMSLPAVLPGEPFPPVVDLGGCIALTAVASADPHAALADLDALVQAVSAGRRDDRLTAGGESVPAQLAVLQRTLLLALAAAGRLPQADAADWLDRPIDPAGGFRAAMATRLHAAAGRDAANTTIWTPAWQLHDQLPGWVPPWSYAWVDTPAAWWVAATAPGHAADAIGLRLRIASRLAGKGTPAPALPLPRRSILDIDLAASGEEDAVEESLQLGSILIAEAWQERACRCAVRIAAGCPVGAAVPRDEAACRRLLPGALDQLGVIPAIRYVREDARNFLLQPGPPVLPELGRLLPDPLPIDLDACIYRGRPWWLDRRPPHGG